MFWVLRVRFCVVCLLALGVCDVGGALVPAYAQMTGAQVRASFSDAVEKVGPAVVNIFTAKRVQTIANPFLADPFFAHIFQGMGVPMQEKIQRSLGSGVIWSKSGHIVTNLHVIQGAEDIKVIFSDGREFTARYVGGDRNLDLAVLQLTHLPPDLVHATVADHDSLQVGDVVLAIGNPFGVGQSVSMGVVSALNRGNAALSQFSNYIQTDAAINPGNSGGALIDSTGKVVGINTAIFSKSGASHGIGFATPMNVVAAVVNSIIDSGAVKRPWLGATGQDVSPELAENLGLSRPMGVLINEVSPAGPAARGGLRVGDVILRLNNQPINNVQELNAQFIAQPYLIGSMAEVVIWRDEAQQTLKIQLDALPARRPQDQIALSGRGHPLSGYVIEEASSALNMEFEQPLQTRGVYIVSKPAGGNAFGTMNTKVGDRIISIDGKEILTNDDVVQALDNHRRGRPWTFELGRGGRVLRILIQ